MTHRYGPPLTDRIARELRKEAFRQAIRRLAERLRKAS